MGSDERDGYRLTAVNEALENAVDKGKSLQYSQDELKKLFLEMVERKYTDDRN
ncbi:hypothetical protein D3C77_623130 [compost metagenome]